MMKTGIAGALLTVLALTSGCPLPEQRTAVELVNDTEHTVDVTLKVGENQDVIELVLLENGAERSFSLAAGETATFSTDCEELQAIIIEDAEMQVLPGLSPNEDTGVFRDGTDFGCGDTLVFTFTQSQLATELRIAFSTR